ncbi:MAG: PolC-type DNA polymerase III, partial [Lachnospiraceae bacterium]|nr:PolC-type DNA polymerase III [Lachnospiraceae bacterium]
DVFYGRNVEGERIEIREITDAIGEVVIRGEVVSEEERETKSGRILVIFTVTDDTDSISCKLFLKPEAAKEVTDHVKPGKFLIIKGVAAMDTYEKEISITSVAGMKECENFRKTRKDEAPVKRVELHAHTCMSDMDALVQEADLVKRAMKWGHPALAITDHGVVQGFTNAFHALQKLKPEKPFKLIYGCEIYLVDDTARMAWNVKGQGFSGSYVVFDLETTGFNAQEDQIIEIGAVKVEGGVITARFSEFVNPEMPIPARITELTSITDEMVHGAKTIRELLPEFFEFIGDSVLVAHNARFDTGFIREKAKQLGLAYDFTVCDTLGMARFLLPHLGRYNLGRLCREFGVDPGHSHRAVDDAEATVGVFLRLLDLCRARDIDSLAQLEEIRTLPEEAVRQLHPSHCIVLAKNDLGRIHLYKIVSEAHLKYFHRVPLVPKSLLMENREGLIIGSACEAGELFQAVVEGRSDEEIRDIVGFYDYLEIQPIGNNAFMIDDPKRENVNNEEDLRELNRQIVRLGEQYGKPVCATCDVHFLDPEDEIYRRIIQAGKGYKDCDRQPPLYLRTTDEMLEEFSYLGEEKAYEVVVANTNDICDRIEVIDPVRPDKCPPVIEDSDKTLTEICYAKAHSMYGDPLPEIVESRLEKELHSIISNGFAVMYIIAQKLVWKSNEDGYLVGSRGSVGSSFVATMSGITEVNPLPAHYYCRKCHFSDFDSPEVKKFAGSSGFDMPDRLCPVCGEPLVKDGHDIPFETFLGFYGDKEPDIDLNFSGEYQSHAHAYTEVIFGEGHTFRAGTIGTLADKTAYGYAMKYFEERGITKRKAEIDRLSSRCVGVKRTTGQHPGGIVVLPHGEEIYYFTPVQRPANDTTTNIITTHFDYHSIDHNLLKLDILGHDDPTMIRRLEDLTGLDAKTIPMDDPGILSLFEDTSALGISPEDIDNCDLGCLGVPEMGTSFVMQMLRDTKPKCFSDLIRISGLSHGTDVWLNNAQEFIAQKKCTLSTAICTRDDIMTFLIYQGVEKGHAFKIMESVRKGRGLSPDMEKEMIDNGVPDWYIESCKRIKYMFPKAHAVAYVMMALRIAYFKIYYPLAYYAAYFSIRAKAFNYELMCQGKEKLEYHLRDYKRRANELSPKEDDTLGDMRLVQEMYARGLTFAPIDLFRSDAVNFQIVDGKLLPPFTSVDGLGEAAAYSIKEAAAQGPFLSVEDFKTRAKVSQTIADTLAELGVLGDIPKTNQISLDDLFSL